MMQSNSSCWLLICSVCFLFLSSCSKDSKDGITEIPNEVVPSNVTIDSKTTYQTIAGFGGANTIWGTDNLTAAEMSQAFGTGDEGLGLSILRVRLSSVKGDWSGLVSTIKGANGLNVKVLASPWSPPAQFKSNNDVVGGGYLLENRYADFASYINEFIDYMKSQSATVDVVSIQNEPDWKASYEGCEYSTGQMFNFVKNYAGTIRGAKVLAAESLNSNHAYTDDILNDALAVKNISIVGGHLYGAGLAAYPLAEQKGKEIWVTEHLLNLDSGNKPENWTATTDPKVIWTETMDMLKEIHTAMSYNWNAYIWWYIRRYYSFLGDGEKGTSRGQILKRGYAISQFSKFIRPGYVRVKVLEETPSASLKMTAYSGENKTVIVVINPSDIDAPKISFGTSGSISSATAYTTSVSKSREAAVITPVNSKVLVNIAANSITTVVLNK
jgi:glucuronoarabinoxylan endo-1,4-beta-xylanase